MIELHLRHIDRHAKTLDQFLAQQRDRKPLQRLDPLHDLPGRAPGLVRLAQAATVGLTGGEISLQQPFGAGACQGIEIVLPMTVFGIRVGFLAGAGHAVLLSVMASQKTRGY
ncbi:hypothetical protein D3C78_383880 [compost metagenome]